MNDDNVSYIRQEVIDSLPMWERIRDCCKGQDAIKARGDNYLPRPNPEDTSDANNERFKAYLLRANYYNVTGHTKKNLVGDAFTEVPELIAPSEVERYAEDIDGSGVTLQQQAQKSFGDVLIAGRFGLLVDYPNTEQPATKAELDAGLIRPKIIGYQAESIINWRTDNVGGNRLLSMVVLKESVPVRGAYSVKTVDQWRELTLDNGDYRVIVYRHDDDVGDYVIHEGPYYPTDASGKRMNRIPFFFIGSENNDTTLDIPPLNDIADLNISHYRNSADYEESCFMVGQPTPVFSGLTERWVNEVMGGQVYLGSRAGVMLPEGGSSSLLQASSNQMPQAAMVEKEQRMRSLGARLVESKQVQRTATETAIDARAEHSTLGLIAGNISSSYTKALEVFAAFIGASGEISYTLNTDYDLQPVTTEERQQLLSEYQAGSITWAEYRAGLRRANVATEDDEAALESIRNTLP